MSQVSHGTETAQSGGWRGWKTAETPETPETAETPSYFGCLSCLSCLSGVHSCKLRLNMECCSLSFPPALDCVQGGRGTSVIERGSYKNRMLDLWTLCLGGFCGYSAIVGLIGQTMHIVAIYQHTWNLCGHGEQEISRVEQII